MSKIKKPIVNKLMEAAKFLFFMYGIRKVSIEEICKEAGVSKMTFYRHFDNKDDIAIKVLGKYFIERMETFEHILQEPIPFEEKLRKIVDIKMEWLKNVDNQLVRDVISDRESAPGKFLGELLDDQARRTREIFVNLQKKGDIRNDIKADLVIYIVENIWKAFSDENLLKLYTNKSQLYEELFKASYYGILPAKTKHVGM